MSHQNLNKMALAAIVGVFAFALPQESAHAHPHHRNYGGCGYDCQRDSLVNRIQNGEVVQVLLDAPVGTLQVGSVIEVYYIAASRSYVTRAYSVYGEYVVTERFGGTPSGHILNIAGAIFEFENSRDLYVDGYRVGRIINM